MKDYEKIHQHIQYALEERGLDKSLSDLFQKHKLLSFKVWRFFSFIALFPFCLENALSSKSLALALVGSSSVPSLLQSAVILSVAIGSFCAPIVISSLLLTHLLPLHKLSKKPFFKRYLNKYLRKFPIIASSCDSIHYKEEFIAKFSKDIDLNLAMSSYYQYLLDFPFDNEMKKSLSLKKSKLQNIEVNPSLYEANFCPILITFLSDFDYFSKSPIVLKDVYQDKLSQYSDNLFHPTDYDSVEDSEDNITEEDISPKKKFKEML